MAKNLFWTLLLLLSSILGIAQNSGIIFRNDMNWGQILHKAKAENKYIFVDCYASWCGPCKWMDGNIYVNDTVGQFINDKFVSVKMQMDSTKEDAEEIRNWYNTAHEFALHYGVDAYPSFLFFSPQGLILYKAEGAKEMKEFISIAKNSLTVNGEIYATQFEKYQKGELEFFKMQGLADTSRKLGFYKRANDISKNYMEKYLSNLPTEQIWTKDNLRFIRSYMEVLNADDKLFQLYFRDRNKIDSIAGRIGYSNRIINSVVFSSLLEPAIQSAIKTHSEPRWKNLTKIITRRYAVAYAEKNLLDAKVEYYKTAKRWKKYVKYFVMQSEVAGINNIKPGGLAGMKLNNTAYEVFKYSDNRKYLKKALTWIDKAISIETEPVGEQFDTKANILYRMGFITESLNLETKAVNLSPESDDIQENFKKMKKGEPTWAD